VIERDVRTYLEADGTLDTLLGAASGDSKIYAVRAPQLAIVPFITITALVGGIDETIDEDIIQLKVVASTVLSLQNIRDRLKVLLDIANTAQTSITSATFRIYWSRFTGSSGTYQDPDTQEYIEVFTYSMKYKKVN